MIDRRRAGFRILLVEDEPANRALVRAIVARANRAELREIVLCEAATIAQARAILADQPVDVVLLDVRLPDGNGLDLAAELKLQTGGSPAKVVIVSASVLPADRSVALATGADAFLAKPFDPFDLIDLIARFSGSQRLTIP